MARGGPGRVALVIWTAGIDGRGITATSFGACIASRRGEFRHRRAEFLDGAAAPRSAMMISGERKTRVQAEELTAEFGIAGILDFVETEHGLVKAAISLDGVAGELYLQGLRAATSLAGLWRDKERTEEARELLAPVYGQFTEGFETTDLNAAKPLVD
jgi:hypothetical protein